MSHSLFIDSGPLEDRVAVIEDGRIAEIHIARAGEAKLRGQIRRGRVTHISSDLQAATVDTGDGHMLFLRAADARILAPAEAQGKVPIAKLVTRGQTLLVQPTRPGMDGKQGRCTADVALFGRFLTLHPMRQGIEAGKDPSGEDLMSRLSTVATEARVSLKPAARQADPDIVAEEADRLLAEWREIANQLKGKPALLRPAQDLMARALTALAGPDPEVILTPDRGTLAELKQLAGRVAPDLTDRIELTEPRRSVDLDDEIEAALNSICEFPGGRLTIEPTRAMTVIDVDGQGAPGKVNTSAIQEIARQLRLRRIGGQVAIDLVTMSKAQERKRIETILRQTVQKAVPQADISGIDRFGIATMVLRRESASLLEEMTHRKDSAPVLAPSARLARLLRQAALELSEIGPLPVVIELPEGLRGSAPRDLADQLSSSLSRPLKISFTDRDIDGYALRRER